MYKFVVLSVVALVACVSAAPGGLIVPVAPAVAVAHPVGIASSYSNTYRAPVVKALPVVHAGPVVHAAPAVVHPVHPVVAAPLVKTSHQVIAHPSPAIVKTSPVVAHAAIPVAVTHVGAPAVSVTSVRHATPLAHIHHGLPVTSYANHYSVHPVVKTAVVAAPVTLVH